MPNLKGIAKNAQLDAVPAYADLYEIGKTWIEDELAILLVPDSACKATGMHRIYKLAKPHNEPGIEYPENFRYYRAIKPEEYDEAQQIWRLKGLAQLPDDVKEFWMPFFMPKASSTSTILELYAAQRLQLQSAYDAQFGGATHSLGISFTPNECIETKEWPTAFIPEKSWFKPDLEAIQIKDVLTLFPDIEQQLLALCFGRAVVGRTNHIPVGRTDPIEHTWRTMPIIFGSEPGQGKSAFANMLIQAMRSVGYRVANFKSMANRFNLGSVVSAHIGYRDDMTSSALKKTLAADDTKQVITGAQVRVENKNTDAFEIWSHALLLANVNRWDPRIVYDLDDGIMDRVKLISTLFNVELAKLVPEGASEGTPSLYPFQHIQFLADKFNCSINTIMLWFLRLCADAFEQQILQKDFNQLEITVKHLSNRLRCQFNADILKCITSAMMLAYTLRQKQPKLVHIPELTSHSLGATLKALRYIVIDKRAHNVRSLIKDDWNDKGRPEGHAWKAVSRLNKASIDLALDKFLAEIAINKQDLPKIAKSIFSAFSLTDGFSVGSGIVYITSAWNESRLYVNSLKTTTAAIHSNITQAELQALTEDADADVGHLYSFDYDSHKLAKES